MNVNEYGVDFRLGVGFDMSSNDELTLIFTKPSGATLSVSKADGVTAPATPASGFSASQYFEYTFANGDVDESGTWSVRGHYIVNSPAQKLISDVATFDIGT